MVTDHLKHYAKRLLGKPTVPPVRGTADAAWYDEAYRVLPKYHDPFWRSHYYPIWTVIVDRVRRQQLRRVVDIGCGPGQFAAMLFQMGEIQQYDGLDFSAHAVEIAKTACPQGRYHVDDATTTDLCRMTPHDVVICMEVLEHVERDDQVISRFQPGIRAICTVPNFDYQSHVRYFTTTAQVQDRYAKLFDDFDVFPILGHHAAHHTYYVMDGVTR